LKRTCCVLLIFCITLVSVAGCGKAELKNYIASKTLSEDQKQIADLISTAYQNYYLFDVKTEDTYKDIDFWMETYKNGELVDSRPVSIHMINDEDKAIDGEFAAIMDKTPDCKWTFIYSEKSGTKVNSPSEPITKFNTDSYASWTIDQPVGIEDGKEIVLYAAAFRQDGAYYSSPDLQSFIFLKNLMDFDYVNLIKCRFTK